MRNNNLIIIGVLAILISVLSYSFFYSNQEQQIQVPENQEASEIVKEFDLVINNRKLTLDLPIISVDLGDEVLLRIQSDEKLMFHIHEYDHEIMVMPNEVKELSFPAMFSGRFEMEIHIEEQEMEIDFSNAKISIASIEVMDSMAMVNVKIEGVELGHNVHWHLKLDELLEQKDDHAALMVFEGNSYTLQGLSIGEHTAYVGIVNNEHELVSEIESQTFVIETNEMIMNPGMNMEEDRSEHEAKPILVGFLEVNPKR